MKVIKKTSLFIFFCFSTILFSSCNKDKPAEGIDLELYDMAQSTVGFTWYKNSVALLPKSSSSGHPQPLLRTRYNSTAASRLDAQGKIMENAVFPEGSLIVKELFKDENDVERYAILYKDSSHEFADAKGWVWGYVNEDGTVAAPASAKGSSCISCHSQSDNIDYMLMNKYFQ